MTAVAGYLTRRLWSTCGTGAVDDLESGHLEPGPDGSFEMPVELAVRLHAVHANGRPMWEDSGEREQRLIQEEAARRADPATLLAAVEHLTAATEAANGVLQA